MGLRDIRSNIASSDDWTKEDASSGSSITHASSDDWTSSEFESTSTDEETSSSEDAGDQGMQDADEDRMEEADEDGMKEADDKDDITSSGESADSDAGEGRKAAVTDALAREERFRVMIKKFKDGTPSLQTWIDSWSEIKRPGIAWLNVYGYFNKDKGYGGYGVILRNDLARPIIAATCFTRQRGGSQFFQVLSGLKIGLDLAVKNGCLRLAVGCNVQRAIDLLGRSSSFKTVGDCYLDDACGSHVKKDGICKDCTKTFVMVKDATFDTLVPVISELKVVQAKVEESYFRFTKISRHENEAAHFLAKMAKRDALKTPFKVSSNVSKEMKPADFPSELQKILWKDAFGCDTRYSHSLRSITANSQVNNR